MEEAIGSTGTRVFGHGVASGDPLTDRVIIWTRVSTGAAEPPEVSWVVASDPGLHAVVAEGTARPDPDRDSTLHVDVGGLDPDRHYHFAFEARGERSPVGRTRTLPADPDRLRFAICSCAILRAMAQGPRNIVVLSGDLHVSMAKELPAPEPGSPAGEATPVAVEVVTTSLTSQNLDEKMGWAIDTESVPVERAFVEAVPHVKWCDFDAHGYAVIDVDSDRVRSEWWFVDTVLERVPGESMGAAFEAQHGRPRLVPVHSEVVED